MPPADVFRFASSFSDAESLRATKVISTVTDPKDDLRDLEEDTLSETSIHRLGDTADNPICGMFAQTMCSFNRL